MKPYSFYMHENCLDVCIEVLKIQYKDSKRVKLKVNWVNLGYVGKPFILQFNRNIEIKREDLVKWKNIDDILYVPRYKKV